MRRIVRLAGSTNGTAPLFRPLKRKNLDKEEFMATRTGSRTSNRSNSSRNSNESRGSESRSRSSGSENRSAFSWGESAGPLLGAALAGVAIGLGANYARKAMMQGMEATVGDWDEIL